MAILDADPNKGAHRWATETYGGGKLTAYAEAETERLAELVPQLADRHEVLIADTAGFGNRSTVICIGAADGVLVPATPGEGDIVEAQKMVAFVQATGRTIRRDIQARVLANRIRRGTTLSRHLLSQIEALGLPRLDTTLSEAVAYGEMGFLPTLPATGQAAAEIAGLGRRASGAGMVAADHVSRQYVAPSYVRQSYNGKAAEIPSPAGCQTPCESLPAPTLRSRRP